MPQTSHKDLSKINWIRPDDNWPGADIIQSGCMQRIADAIETVAKNYDQLLRDRNFYRDLASSRASDIKHLENQIAGYKAARTRRKRREL